MSYLHSRLGGHEEPDHARDVLPRTAPQNPQTEAQTPSQTGPQISQGERADERFRRIRCRSEVTGLHAVNLVADISDAAASAPIVIVDLSLTARIDAVGLGVLVSGARTCRDAGSELRIVGAHGMVAQALRFTGLSRALSTHATVEDALRGK